MENVEMDGELTWKGKHRELLFQQLVPERNPAGGEGERWGSWIPIHLTLYSDLDGKVTDWPGPGRVAEPEVVGLSSR